MAGDGIRLAPDLLMPLDAVTEKFAIIGNSGMGKSTAATTFVEQFHACGLPSVVLDVKGDWWGLRSSRDGTGPGLPFVIFGGEHGDVPLEPTAGALVADTVIDYQLPAIVDMSLMSKRKARTFATAFAEQLYVRNRDPLMVVVDEADVLIPQRPDAETWRLVGAMEDIAKRGRGRGLGLTIASQRGQEVNQSVLDIMGTVILLGMTGRLTIKAVRDWIGVNADSDEVSAREVIGSLPSLQVGEAWVWSPAFLRLVKRVQIDMFTTYDSHFTPKPGQRRAAPVDRAEIDLAKLGEEIAATVERAQATDPRALRAQVTALTRRNTELQDRNQELQAALEAAQAAEPERVEVPAPLPGELVTGAKAILVALDAVLDGAAAARSETDTVMRVIDRQRTDTAMPPPERADGRRPAAGPVSVPEPAAVAARVVPAQPRVRDRAGSPTAREGVALTKAEQAVLTVLAAYAPNPRSATQVALIAQYSSKGGGFRNSLGALRAKGLITGGNDAMTITETGLAALGEYQPLPTGSALVEHWTSSAVLGRAESAALRAIVDAYPDTVSSAEVAERTGYEPGGGGFRNALGKLRSLELIVGGNAAMRAADELVD